MRVFKTKAFGRFQRKEHIDDKALLAAVTRAERGLIDARLGGCLVKQRVARPREGRSGGFRTVIAYRSRAGAVFLYGFAKSRQENISMADERDLQDYGAMILDLDAKKGVLRPLKEAQTWDIDRTAENPAKAAELLAAIYARFPELRRESK